MIAGAGVLCVFVVIAGASVLCVFVMIAGAGVLCVFVIIAGAGFSEQLKTINRGCYKLRVAWHSVFLHVCLCVNRPS